MKYILIESIEAYEHTKKLYNNELNEIVWITTSPFIINFFSSKKINFIEIEKFIDQEELNDLQKICSDFNDNFVSFLNEESSWRDYIDFKYVFSASYHHYLSSLIYKCLIIIKIQENFKEEIIVVGDTNEEENINNKNILFYSRFANIYSILAHKYFPDIKVIDFKQNKEVMAKKDYEVKHGSMNFNEKILSILNNNLSSFFFKIFSKLSDYNLIKKINLFYLKKNNQIVVYSPTDTIECAFTKLLNKGYEFKFIKMPKMYLKEPLESECINFYTKHKNFLLKNFKDLFNKYKKVKYNLKFEPILESAIKKVINKKFRIKENLSLINNNFEKKIQEFDKNHFFFSNYIFDEIPILYVMFLKKIKNAKIVFFEHGVVQGLGETQKYRINFNPMSLADIGVYSWKKSLLFEKDLSHQRVLISGFSFKQFTNSLKYLKKYFIKKFLKIKNNKKSIIYVADIEKNNYIFGPYLGNDLNYYQDTREILEHLCKNNTDKNIFLKLYPTNRYMQNYDFTDLKTKYSNLYILRKIDFRFIREFFDEIYLSSYQSTLGWALASQKNVYVVERNVSPINLDGLIERKVNIDLKGIKNFVLLNKNFEKDNFDWIKKLT